MAYLTQRIAGFEFIAILGAPDESAQMLSIDSWGGVNGVDFTDEGKKGTPFSILTVVDANDKLDADLKVRAYKDLIAQGSVSVTQDGEILTDRFKVLAVVPSPIRKISTSVGNKKSAQAGALLECRWDLIALP
jgi:hypothetical protein